MIAYNRVLNKNEILGANTIRHSVSVDTLSSKTKLSTKKCTSDNESVALPSQSTVQYSNATDKDNEKGKQLTVLNLWYHLDKHDEDISVRLDPRIKEARKIGLNSRLIPILEKNDKVQLPTINDQHYLLKIKSINKNSNNDIEIYGELDHNGKVYASTLSLTKKVVLALLSTPNGHFDVRMVNDKGYIYQSDQLDDIEAVVDLPSFLN